jgi:hypothetical protein
MRLRTGSTVLVTVFVLVAAAIPAAADHSTREHTKNLRALGHSPQPATFEVPDGERLVNSDLAFQGRLAFHGNYNGFRVIDVSSPRRPRLISHPRCNGDQGDIVVWKHILVRSWNSPAPEGRTCDDQPVPAGFEGVHIFDISNPSDPSLIGALELECGSHTATAAGVDDGDLIVYSNNSSSTGCAQAPDNPREADDPLGDFMDIIAVPLDDPGDASVIHREPLAGPETDIRTGCHDVGVILGKVDKAACASADTINVWDVSDVRDPELQFTVTEPGVGQAGTDGRWHSATFTWDGEVIVAGWEPGGGAAARCQETGTDLGGGLVQTDAMKSMFFYDADTGAKLGQWILPRVQGPDENCTIHNYNVVPLRSDRYVVVSGNYQAGTWVTDFTNPARPRAVAWSDPESLGPGSACGGLCTIGGAWSSYWYNGEIYESDITTGLNIFDLRDRVVRGAIRLGRLNPQTQEKSLR